MRPAMMCELEPAAMTKRRLDVDELRMLRFSMGVSVKEGQD